MTSRNDRERETPLNSWEISMLTREHENPGNRRWAPVNQAVAVLADNVEHANAARMALEAEGLELAALGEQTQAHLQGLIGPRCPARNPLALVWPADTAVLLEAIDALMADLAVGAVLLVGIFDTEETDTLTTEATAAELVLLSAWHCVPLLVQLANTKPNHTRHILHAARVPILPTVSQAARVATRVTADNPSDRQPSRGQGR